MTKAISMAIELDQDIMVTNMGVKFGEDWTNCFQELDQKQSSGRTDKGNPICCHNYLQDYNFLINLDVLIFLLTRPLKSNVYTLNRQQSFESKTQYKEAALSA